MKKLLAFTAALSLASASFALPSTAAADTTGTGNSGPASICQAGLAASLGLSQGDCVSALSSSGGANANAICNYLEFNLPAVFASFPSFGACVSFVNANILNK